MENGSKNVFTNRNFRLVFLGALVSETGAILFNFAAGFYILEISGNNAFLQGLILALSGAVMLIMTPIGGVLGDRINKATIMFICDYIKGGLIILTNVLMLLFRSPGAHIVLLFFVSITGSAVSGIFSPAAGSLLPHIVEEDQLQQGNSYFSIKNSLQGIIGIVLAGVLYAAMSIYALFFLVGACYVASGVSEMFIRYEHKRPQERLTVRVALGDIKGGVKYLGTQRAIVALMASILFINFFLSPVTGNFIPFFIKTDVAGAPSYIFSRLLTPELWASVFSVLTGISSLVGAVILSSRPQIEKVGRRTALLLCWTAVVMIALAVSYWQLVARGVSLNVFLLLFCLGCVILGALIVNINIPLNTTVMRVIDKDMLSKVSSLISIASQGLIPIASVLAGAVLQYMGSTVLLAVCALGFTAAAVMLLLSKSAREI
ncbi:MAG: MFS transporter [Firmicutes bacterium]|nr:MFS transporter [Bacillota bacterium]